MTKMGRYNKITAERFHAIKGALAMHWADETVMRQYQIKSTTLRYIKQSKSYYEYRLRTERCKLRGKMPKVILPICGMELIDYPPRKDRRSQRQKESLIYDQDEDRFYKSLCISLLVVPAILFVLLVASCVVLIKLLTVN